MSLAAKAFRSSTAALSSANLARPALGHCRSRLSRLGTRCYSEEKTSPPPQEGTSKPDPDPTTELQEKLKAKEEEVKDLTGRLRYLQADFLNLQRNSAREKEQTKDFAISRFASDLLETVDVLSIALKSVPPEALKSTGTDLSAGASGSSSSLPHSTIPAPLPKTHEAYLQELHTGVDMTHRLLLQTLFKYHVKPFDPTGDPFDPNLHEALYQAPIPGKEPGTVIDCQKTGFKIKDRVLRAAQVGVSQETS